MCSVIIRLVVRQTTAGLRGGSAQARSLLPTRSMGFDAVPASVSKTCLVASTTTTTRWWPAVRRPINVHGYADRIVIRQDGRIVAEHPPRPHPWHYVPVLARKLGALRNGRKHAEGRVSLR